MPATTVIGGLNNGWAVANTTLMFERAGLGAGGGYGGRLGRPRPAPSPATSTSGPATSSPAAAARGGGGGRRWSAPRPSGLIELAKGNGKIDDPTVRQELMKLHTLGEIARFNNLRLKAAKDAGQDIPGLRQHLQAAR